MSSPKETFHSSDLAMGAHAFTHVDAPWHVDPDGHSITDIPLDRLFGTAALVDVSDLGPGAALDAEALAARGEHVHSGDIVLLRSDQLIPHTPPYMRRDMTDQLAPGATAALEWTVEERHCTRRGDHDIFSTPNLVLFLEETAMEALAPYLREEQGSVGSQVQIAHVTPTLKGQRVKVTATVTEVDRRRVAFSIVAEDDVETVGHGTHERFIVDLDRFGARLEQKSAAPAEVTS